MVSHRLRARVQWIIATGTVVAGLVLFANFSSAAVHVNCTSSPGALATLASQGPLSGQYLITGTCTGDVFIFNSDATIAQDSGGGQLNESLIVEESSVTLNTITLNGTGGDNQGVQINTSSPGNTALRPSVVSLIDVTLENFPDSGLHVGGGGRALVSGGLITHNKNCGIFVVAGAHLEISGAEISLNGNDNTDTSPGDQCGIHAEYGASVVVNGSNIHNNNGPALWLSHATADVETSTLSSPTTVSFPVIVAPRGSLNLIGDTIVGSNHAPVIFASPGASVTLQGSSVSENDASDPTILADDGSVVLSLGGNTITNSASGGSAIAVTNTSAFKQRNESVFLITLAADSVSGAGVVQVQSSMELGLGLVGGNPSISWTTGSNGIQVQQNSSFRVSGGVSITGAVTITQGSNAFANTANGGTNAITSASCPFTNVPSSHWAAPAKVTPSVPSATSYSSATSPQCLAF